MSFIRPLLPSPASLFTSAITRSGRPAPTLVLDLDDTVLFRTRGLVDAALVYGLPPALAAQYVGVPYAGALDALRDLARVFRIVALTARWAAGARYTDAWLARHGLAGMPVIVARAPHPGDDSRVAFKSAAIAWLQETGWAPVVGVGDRPSDLEAYVASGLHACVVAHVPPVEGSGVAAHDAACWRVLGAAAARAASLRTRSTVQPQVAYFTDSAGVHAAAAAVAGEAPSSPLACLPPPSLTFGPTTPLRLQLFRPGGGSALVPRVWNRAQLHGYLQALAEQNEAKEGG